LNPHVNCIKEGDSRRGWGASAAMLEIILADRQFE
jgi:hypothetical protein